MADSFYIKGGTIYSAAADVTTASTELGEFEGNFVLNSSMEISTRFSQKIVEGDPQVMKMTSSVTIGEMSFDPDTYMALLGLSAASASLRSTAKEDANKWAMTATAVDVDLAREYLLEGTRADNGKKIQFWIAAGGMPGLPGLILSAGSRAVMDVTIPLYRDTDDSYWELAEEL